jgi:hypothetical protein
MEIASDALVRRDSVRQAEPTAREGHRISPLRVDQDAATRGRNGRNKWISAAAMAIVLVVVAVISYLVVLAPPTGASSANDGMEILQYLFGH